MIRYHRGVLHGKAPFLAKKWSNAKFFSLQSAAARLLLSTNLHFSIFCPASILTTMDNRQKIFALPKIFAKRIPLAALVPLILGKDFSAIRGVFRRSGAFVAPFFVVIYHSFKS